MLVHLRRENPFSNKLKIDSVESNFHNFHCDEIRTAIEKLLETPGLAQVIQEDPDLHIVWDHI